MQKDQFFDVLKKIMTNAYRVNIEVAADTADIEPPKIIYGFYHKCDNCRGDLVLASYKKIITTLRKRADDHNSMSGNPHVSYVYREITTFEELVDFIVLADYFVEEAPQEAQ